MRKADKISFQVPSPLQPPILINENQLKITNFQCSKGGMWRDNPRPPDSPYDVTNMDNHGKTEQGWGLTKFMVAGQNLTEIEITVRFKDDMMGQ